VTADPRDPATCTVRGVRADPLAAPAVAAVETAACSLDAPIVGCVDGPGPAARRRPQHHGDGEGHAQDILRGQGRGRSRRLAPRRRSLATLGPSCIERLPDAAAVS